MAASAATRTISAMPAKRMNRDEFFAKLAPLGEDGLAKAVIADRYLAALDEIARAGAARSARRPLEYGGPDWDRKERGRHLAEWHDLLLDRLDGSEAADRLDRLASHPALGGPELTFVQAKLAHRRMP
jgi:hypothetical protein